jgi:cytochrome P450
VRTSRGSDKRRGDDRGTSARRGSLGAAPGRGWCERTHGFDPPGGADVTAERRPTASPGPLGPESLTALFAPSQRSDPYPGYARLRETAPIWEAGPGLWVLSRHADCARILRDARFGHLEGDGAVSARARTLVPGGSDASREPVRSFLALNPPDHTRLRRLVSRWFTPSRVEALAPRIEAITASLLDAVVCERGFDVVSALASPLPVAVIGELLGVPSEDRPRLVAWGHALARGLDPAFLVSEEERRLQAAARDSFAAYMLAEIARRRSDPGCDLVSDLVAAHDRGEPLTQGELIATCILLLVAGHETTTNLLANGLYALLCNPDQLEAVATDPRLVAGAIEELLRYDSPVQLTMRVALEDADVAGAAVPQGTFVLLLIGAANRDPLVYEDPDRLDVRRAQLPHLAFGQGIHFCLGAPLARLEAQIALRALLSRFKSLRLARQPTWKENAVLRGLDRLDVVTE